MRPHFMIRRIPAAPNLLLLAIGQHILSTALVETDKPNDSIGVFQIALPAASRMRFLSNSPASGKLDVILDEGCEYMFPMELHRD